MNQENIVLGKLSLKYELRQFIAGFSLFNSPQIATADFQHLLHPSELTYFNSPRFEKRRLAYLSGRVAAKKAISSLLPDIVSNSFSIDEGVFKFPVVKELPNIQVSISHSESFTIALAFPEEHPMGIDIEKIDHQKLASMKSQIIESELDLTCKLNLSPSTNCTILWTIKEALSKVLKTGLTINFKLLEIKTLEKSNTQYISTFANFHQYKAISFCAENYVCTVVLPAPTEVDLSKIWDGLIGK